MTMIVCLVYLEWLVSARKEILELVLMLMTEEECELHWETFSQLLSAPGMEEILLLNKLLLVIRIVELRSRLYFSY